jgi:DNA-binding MarR family transcriptional regulator
MEYTLARLLAILHRRNVAYLNRTLKPYQITSGEVGILVTLYQGENRSQEELSTLLCIDKAAIARALSSLEQKGYVERLADERDKRCNRIVLTERARELKSTILPLIQGWSHHLALQMGDDAYTQLFDHLSTILTLTDQENTPL